MYKLNKYLIKIINEYAIPDIDDLIKETPKYRNTQLWHFNQELTIEDVLIKCIQMGFRGFFIASGQELFIDEIEKKINENIDKYFYEKQTSYQYSFKKDKRDLYFIDILKLEGVYSIENITVKN